MTKSIDVFDLDVSDVGHVKWLVYKSLVGGYAGAVEAARAANAEPMPNCSLTLEQRRSFLSRRASRLRSCLAARCERPNKQQLHEQDTRRFSKGLR